MFGNRALGRVSGNRGLGVGIEEQGICGGVDRNICGNVHGSMRRRIITSVVSEELAAFVSRVT